MRAATLRNRNLRRFALALPMACAIAATATFGQTQANPERLAPAAASGQQPVVLDSVIAVINGDVLLRSDLQDEMDFAALQPLSLPAGQNFERRAAQRLINRTLILQQMQLQGMTKEITDTEVQADLAELRKQIPACVAYHCQTDEGWEKFLAENNLTSAEVETRWRQRMQILGFIDARFRAGVRISQQEIREYYEKTLLPQFKSEDGKPPTLASVSGRIEEVLLQQHVNVLLADWLKSLRDQGNVIILDAALGKSNPSPDADDDGGAE